MRQLILFFLFFPLGLSLFSQSIERFVVASAGDYFTNTQANVSLEFTVGEMTMVESFYANNHWLTQGFHQPENKETSIEETNIFEEFVIFPNPASDQARVRYQLMKPGTLSLRLINMAGVVLLEMEEFPYWGGEDMQEIQLDRLAQGMYFVEATYHSLDGSVEISEMKKLSVVKY